MRVTGCRLQDAGYGLQDTDAGCLKNGSFMHLGVQAKSRKIRNLGCSECTYRKWHLGRRNDISSQTES